MAGEYYTRAEKAVNGGTDTCASGVPDGCASGAPLTCIRNKVLVGDMGEACWGAHESPLGHVVRGTLRRGVAVIHVHRPAVNHWQSLYVLFGITIHVCLWSARRGWGRRAQMWCPWTLPVGVGDCVQV